MNGQIKKLAAIAAKPERRIIGLMSGTSLDGLDIALCRVSGQGTTTSVAIEAFHTEPYPEEVKTRIRDVFAKQQVDMALLVSLNGWIGKLHGRYINEALARWGVAAADVDLVASHGQTVFHHPKHLHPHDEYANATLQIGDGDHVAVETGIITLSDFRQKHVAAGGEGAPLALYGDYFLFTKPGKDRLLLNMGGIANFTYLPGDADLSRVLVTDTGPGNTLIDAFTRRHFGLPFDEDARLARQGHVHEALLTALKSDPYFSAPIPKTTGPEQFSEVYVEKAMAASDSTNIAHQDLLATLTRFSAESISGAVYAACSSLQNLRIYASGGGARNPLLLQWISELLPGISIGNTSELGVDGDAKEAVLFAVLANEAVAGEPLGFERKGYPGIRMGKLSFPF